ncbi:MAG TPA: hypothetical protein VHL11_05175 [Phototrophicaceae bacterium]|jgi:osmotically-inducible protein OsmY|nr:hypothetical protein [Phototrophicaceae bacterium]
MTETSTDTSTSTVRPDIDIHSDLQNLLVHYPPLAHDRHRLTYTVQHGVVTVAGYLKSRTTYHYLVNNLPLIAGVAAVSHEHLYHDDDIRLEVGRVVPFGVFANVEYGEVKLTGSLPANVIAEDLAQKIGAVPGVHRVITALK